MTEEELEKYQKAKNCVLRGIDIESASCILQEHLDYTIIDKGTRVNVLRIAIKQILNYVEETKNKDILDVTREKVELKERINKAIGHIEACKTSMGNYILSQNETEYLLEILKGETENDTENK